LFKIAIGYFADFGTLQRKRVNRRNPLLIHAKLRILETNREKPISKQSCSSVLQHDDAGYYVFDVSKPGQYVLGICASDSHRTTDEASSLG
jgi:hypothetical protein